MALDDPPLTSPSRAPIALFVFNRLDHTQRVVEALKQNDLCRESVLYVFSDGPRSAPERAAVEAVRHYCRGIDGFREVRLVAREQNLGLAKQTIQSLSEVFSEHDRLIFLEDDNLITRNYLAFMNAALERYRDDKRIFSISGYCFPLEGTGGTAPEVFLFERAFSWGIGTWRDRWEKVDWDVRDFEAFIQNGRERSRFNRGGEDLTDMLAHRIEGKVNSWSVRWAYAHFRNHAYCLMPAVSLVHNIGHDGSGTHCGDSTHYDVTLTEGAIPRLPDRPEEWPPFSRQIRRYMKYGPRGRLRKWGRFLRWSLGINLPQRK